MAGSNHRSPEYKSFWQEALKPFLKHVQTTDIEEISDENDFAQVTLKKICREINVVDSKYIDLRFLRPTSNVTERLFSVAGMTYSDNRKKLLPANLEIQLFLKQWRI